MNVVVRHGKQIIDNLHRSVPSKYYFVKSNTADHENVQVTISIGKEVLNLQFFSSEDPLNLLGS